MEPRNATAAAIGAGDYIGAAIAKKFALEGFGVFADGVRVTSLRRWSRRLRRAVVESSGVLSMRARKTT